MNLEGLQSRCCFCCLTLYPFSPFFETQVPSSSIDSTAFWTAVTTTCLDGHKTSACLQLVAVCQLSRRTSKSYFRKRASKFGQNPSPLIGRATRSSRKVQQRGNEQRWNQSWVTGWQSTDYREVNRLLDPKVAQSEANLNRVVLWHRSSRTKHRSNLVG